MSRRLVVAAGRRGVLALALALVSLVLGACNHPLVSPPPRYESGPGDEPLPSVLGLPSPPLEALAVVPPAALGASFPVFTDPGELPVLRIVDEHASADERVLPLEHTHVKAALHGFVAEVEVSQTYRNPSTRPIEAVYVFPLPENSAVDHMRMVIGERVVEARIEERQQARRIYDTAKREGRTAALLEQERPNVFTQSVANIEPGKKIDVVVRYVQDLSYDAGEYEFVFPMVVGPRFVQPTGPAPGANGPSAPGSGTYADTPAVPDASRITPPVYGRGERSGHDISLELVVDAGTTVSDLAVPTHEVVVRRPADGTTRLTLAEKDSVPNRDFVMRYRAATPQPTAALLTSGGSEGYFSLVVQPPALDVDELVGSRELVFVVDVSGSMSGAPLAKCQAAMREAVSNLRPVDTFNVVTFAGATAKLFPTARPANAGNVREALRFVEAMRAGGGTYMLDGITAALTPDVGAGRHRYVFFMTDGYVGIEDQIVAATRTFVARIEAEGRRARVFGFGVGSSVNRALIDGLSREGKGLAVYATSREDPARAVNQFYRYIDRSVLRDLRVDWGELAVSDVMPMELPDLFASHPLVIHGRYRGAANASIRVHATSAAGSLEVPVTVVDAVSDVPREALGTLWARSKIAWLEPDLMGPGSADAQREITALGLEHHVVTRFTSFVAVDESRRVGDGNPETVVQPVHAPEGVDTTMAGAREVPDARTSPHPPPPAKSPDLRLSTKPTPSPPPPLPSPPTALKPAEAGGAGDADESVGEAADYRGEERQSLDYAPAPPEAERGSRGCHCSLVPSSQEGGWAALLAVGLGVGAGLRRRRRPSRRRAHGG